MIVSEGGSVTVADITNFIATDATVIDGRFSIISEWGDNNINIDLSEVSGSGHISIQPFSSTSTTTTITGSSGNDHFIGAWGEGQYILDGGPGDDILSQSGGGAAVNILTGGPGADTFQISGVYSGSITDFNPQEGDTIEFISYGGGPIFTTPTPRYFGSQWITYDDSWGYDERFEYYGTTKEMLGNDLVFTTVYGNRPNLNATFTFKNVDGRGPVLESISIRDRELSVGDTLVFDLEITEATGVASSKIILRNEYFGGHYELTDPEKDGTYELQITSDMPIGTYRIWNVDLTDTTPFTNWTSYILAGNDQNRIYGDSSDTTHNFDASALTFTVTHEAIINALNYTPVSWEEVGFTPPSQDTVVTQVIETYYTKLV